MATVKSLTADGEMTVVLSKAERRVLARALLISRYQADPALWRVLQVDEPAPGLSTSIHAAEPGEGLR